jgi:signal transduction histidine kinase
VSRGLWITGAVLGLAAVVESVARLGGDTTVAYGVLVCLMGLATTAPLAVRNPTLAAVSITAACVFSLTVLDTLTVAGIVAQLIVAYRCGGGTWPAGGVGRYLALPIGVPNVSGPLSALVPLRAVSVSPGGCVRDAKSDGSEPSPDHGDHTARGERARIARELHDVVAHHISMISVQAENARLTTPGVSAAVAQRFSAIGDTARAALTEMRRLLGVLREDSQADVAVRQPQPGLGQLNALLDEARDTTGAGTRLILRGPPVTLDPGVELAAYRIVQEALTNSRRHAPGAAVDVELYFTATALRLLIRDNGPGAPGPALAIGHGLMGMRERAIAVGGQLRAGPGENGGFLVEATLPANAESAA